MRVLKNIYTQTSSGIKHFRLDPTAPLTDRYPLDREAFFLRSEALFAKEKDVLRSNPLSLSAQQEISLFPGNQFLLSYNHIPWYYKCVL